MKLISYIVLIILLIGCRGKREITKPTPVDVVEVHDINELNKIVELEYVIDEANYVESSMIVEEGRELLEPEVLVITEVSNNRVSSSTTGGHVAYKIPTEMTVRSTYQVIVRISKSRVHIYENLNGDVKTSTIPITETMEVKVIDPSPSDNKMFEIIPDNQPIQLVEDNEDVTQWTFNVTPVRSGTSKLKVVISIIKNGVMKEVVYEDEVTVKTDVTKTVPFFIATYWQWLLTTLIIPFIVWFVKSRKKEDKEEK
jgi:hypothetical protein